MKQQTAEETKLCALFLSTIYFSLFIPFIYFVSRVFFLLSTWAIQTKFKYTFSICSIHWPWFHCKRCAYSIHTASYPYGEWNKKDTGQKRMRIKCHTIGVGTPLTNVFYIITTAGCNSQIDSTNSNPKRFKYQTYFHLIYSNDHQLNSLEWHNQWCSKNLNTVNRRGTNKTKGNRFNRIWKWYLLSFQDEISVSITLLFFSFFLSPGLFKEWNIF